MTRTFTQASLALATLLGASGNVCAAIPAPETYSYKQVAGLEIKADVHLPEAGSGRRPVVVYIHGGSLINGRRESVQKWPPAEAFISAGVAVVSIDYRLAPESKLPAIIEDLEDAFRWVRQKGPELFGANPDAIAVAGGSAGGYLALVAGYRVAPRPRVVLAEMSYGDLIGDWQMRPSIHPPHYADSNLGQKEAWAQVSGPPIANANDRKGDGSAFNDFIRRNARWPQAISGWDPVAEAEKFTPYSPLRNVTREYPPTFLLHGAADTDVPATQPQAMAAELARHGVAHRLVLIDGAEHGFRGGDPAAVAVARAEAVRFVLDRIKPGVTTSARPSGVEEPVRFTGAIDPAPDRYDGRLPHAVGVHNIQAFRANRTRPPNEGMIGFTYNHQPYLAYWNGRFYLEFLSALFQEHEPPTYTSVMISDDGYTWSPPQKVFPEYVLPAIEKDGVPAGMTAVMHQRMGFYAAPNGKLLVLGFYGYCATPQNSPNAGNGLGRVVREIKADGTFGPIYFIRYNRHAGWNETNTAYPFYKTTTDTGFLEACESLLADKLYTLQWWEEDRGKDGFYAIEPDKVAGAAEFNANIVTAAGAGKAFAWYTRPDGVIVGLWKNKYSALTTDRGETWTPIVENKTLRTTGAKTWGQRTDDGRYVIVHNHSANGINRYPETALVGSDGNIFDTILCLNGEVSPRRFRGQYKGAGTQYFRGITEGNGNPPGDYLWTTYSMNKEDIWVSRSTVPLSGVEPDPLKEDFEGTNPLDRWNLHLPQWAPSRVVREPGSTNHVLELRDEDPYEHARSERVFPSARRVTIRFRVNPKHVAHGVPLEIEVQSQRHDRPMRLRISDEWFSYDHGRRAGKQLRVKAQRWCSVELDFDCERQAYALKVNGETINDAVPFTEPTETVERIVFRTGPWRGQVPPQEMQFGGERPSGIDTEDRPGADEKAGPSVFWIDDLTTS